MSSSSAYAPPYHPSQPEETIPPLPQTIPDPPDETPTSDQVVPPSSSSLDALPPLVLGCATFGYGIYSETNDVLSDIPYRTVRYALRAGINAFDTAPYYHPSEIVLGQVLKRLEGEFPRSSYKIITKVGKYGSGMKDHTYDKESIRQSVERSLKRLHTDYLDVVYCHDVEFVASTRCPAGNHLDILKSLSPTSDPCHLLPPHEPLGQGDIAILTCLRELRALQKEGKIKRIGIAGYPLPILLRLCLLAQADSTVGPLDVIQTYAHQTLQNDNLTGFLPAFGAAGVGQIMNASPLSLGLLTTAGPPSWHAMVQENKEGAEAAKEASEYCLKNGTKLEVVATQFGFKELRQMDGKRVPSVIGCKNVDEVKMAVDTWRKVNIDGEEEKMAENVSAVKKIFADKGVRGYCWSVPSQEVIEAGMAS